MIFATTMVNLDTILNSQILGSSILVDITRQAVWGRSLMMSIKKWEFFEGVTKSQTSTSS